MYTQNMISEKKPTCSTPCASIRSSSEPHLKCLMNTKNNQKYCPMHLIQANIIDFDLNLNEVFGNDEKKIVRSDDEVYNPIIRKIQLIESSGPSVKKNEQSKTRAPKPASKKKLPIYEQKVSTIENSCKENEDDLEIKLLILMNDDEYNDVISDLIGPVFNNVTVSEDDQDPVTLDKFWIIQNNIKIPTSINKYLLFSYVDIKNKIRCFTIFTMHNMIQNDNFIHPVTLDPINEIDIARAKKLIDMYQTKIGLFKKNDLNCSPEFKLKNKLTSLFKQFHIHNIYLEENWLLLLDDKNKLLKIIRETKNLIDNNLELICPGLGNPNLFQKKDVMWKKTNKNKIIFELKEYITGEWERLIQIANDPQNQIPIWILVSGLSFATPEIKQKYPAIDVML